MTGSDFEKSVVALVCWTHGHKELYRGCISIASVLSNRFLTGDYESIYDAAVEKLVSDVLLQYPDPRDPEFQKLLQGIEALFSGNLIDKTDGATNWVDIRYTSPPHLDDRTTQIGQLIFLK